MTCSDKNKHMTRDGRCCDRCPAGKYVQAGCTDNVKTNCEECRRGHFTATENYMIKCQVCKECSSSNNQRKVADCKADKDTVCECLPGYYCSTDECDHCQPLTHCSLGEGVKVQATRTSNVICEPCQSGTFSNVTDSYSTCKAHTRCENYGGQLKTPGTSTTDAVCGKHTSYCSWMLPAGLWSGLVLTILIGAAILFWKAKRRSYKTASRRGPETPLEIVPSPPITPPPELSSHCQESCITDESKLALFSTDGPLSDFSQQDGFLSSLPKTPLKVAKYNHINGNGNLLRSHSEPQEDEWCGT